MKKKLLAGLAIGLFLVGMVGMANATTIDFSTIATGSYSAIGDVTFSLAGTGESGTPYVSSGYLWNSVDGPAYPTNTILRVDFSSMVAVEIDFNNFGSSASTWSLFDGANGLLASSTFTYSSIQTFDFTGYSGVEAVEFNNLGNNWYFGLSEIRYDPVPEPASMLLLGSGLVGLAGFRRKKFKK